MVAIAMLMALQAAVPAPVAAQPPLAAIDFDLAEYARRQQAEGRCGGASTGGEIIVCGRRPGTGDYDLEKWEKIFREDPLVAETNLGNGVTGRAYTEQVDFGNGFVSKRAMVGIKIGF
jgi:hypothetical protein